MSARTRHRRCSAVALLLGLALLVSGCVGLPSSGSVHTLPPGQQIEDEAPVDFTPGGPRPGAAPVEIVRGFLIAMQATPLNTSVARRFLTPEGSSGWVPERGTVVYSEETRTALGDDVRLDLGDIVRLDGRGSWLGRKRDARYRLDLVRVSGEWRIRNPPDRLIIPTSHFESRFTQYFLYFFDKAGEVLVPEPVYVPTGAQATTSLISGLLRGPGSELLGVERTYLPARTVLDDISVPITLDGTAEVPLSDQVLSLDDEELSLAYAQMAWTLAQVPGVERLRVTVDGSPLELPGGGPDTDVADWSQYDPAVDWASQSLFGVREGRVVAIAADEERRVSGPMGSLDLGIRKIGVDLPAERVAATTQAGAVLVGSRARAAGTEPDASDVRTVYTGGSHLLPPAWDLYGQLWIVDAGASGATISLLRKEKLTTVQAEGISGEDVRSFLLSRDGTRLVAVVRREDGDRLLIARVERYPSGRVRGIAPAEEIPLAPLLVDRVRDIGWRTPGSLALLTAPTPDTTALVVAKVDGSSSVTESTTDAETYRGRASGLVTSPVSASALYIRTDTGQMLALAANGRWFGAGIEPGLRSPTFVG